MARQAKLGKFPIDPEPGENDDERSSGIPEGFLSGFSRAGDIGEEKDGGDDFPWGDGTKIQPALNQIHKIGHLIKRADYSNIDIEDLDAGNQSYFSVPVRQPKSEADVGVRETGVGSGDTEDTPITATDEDTDDVTEKSKVGYISKIAMAAMADEIRKLAYDVFDMGPEQPGLPPLPPQPNAPDRSTMIGQLQQQFANPVSDAKKTINLARKLWEAKAALI